MGTTLIIVVALAVALPLAMISAAEMYKRHLAFKERELELMAERAAEKSARDADHVQKLEARVRVLERIATDRGHDVAHQIEALRDTPGNEMPAIGRAARGAV